MNPTYEIIRSRLENLVTTSKAFKVVSHGGTRGELREDLLIDFFSQLIPSQFQIKKGLICDSQGNISKQTDFIVYDPAIVRSIILSGNIGLIPIEAVHLQAEIKSKITKDTFGQVDEQIKRLHQMRIAGSEEYARQIIVPTVVLGYSCDVNKETLESWLSDSQKRPNLVGVCIFELEKQRSFLRVGEREVKTIEADAADPWRPTIVFISKIYDALLEIAKKRQNFKADWSQYLK